MKVKSGVTLILLIALLAALPVSAQKRTVMKLEGENLFLFQELILALGEEDGKVVVVMAPPEEGLPKEYEGIDIKSKDIVVIMNGKRVNRTSIIKEMYEKLEPGDTIKLGLKRGEEMYLAEFKKIDPEKAPGRMMIRKKVSDYGGEPEKE